MRYILHKDFRFRGYQKLPTGLFFFPGRHTEFLPAEKYRLLLKCDGAHDLDPDSLSEEERRFLKEMEDDGIIRPAWFGEYLLPEQNYRLYPAEFRRECHWSVTGCCNLKCRHCLMSAPHAKHGAPSLEQLTGIAEQLAECGVFRVGITGGEPLTRGDFLPLLDELARREILVTTLFTNGWLVYEALLDAFEARKMRPAFQLSFDGIGWHDFLRGVEGSEERALAALRLLQKRGYRVSVSMCLHRHNVGTIRETVRLLGSLGVRSMKIGPMMPLGEWAKPENREFYLSRSEAIEAFCEYIPRYFEDDAPVDIMLGGSFMFNKGQGPWEIYHVHECSLKDEGRAPSCGVLLHNFYISAEGRVAPCMGMDDCGYAVRFPNLFQTPLREILHDSPFTKLECTTVKEVRDANPKCRTCAHMDRCTGGCRSSALLAGDDYYGIDTEVCAFFENGWDQRITAVAEPAYHAYCLRHPEQKESEKKQRSDDNTDF